MPPYDTPAGPRDVSRRRVYRDGALAIVHQPFAPGSAPVDDAAGPRWDVVSVRGELDMKTGAWLRDELTEVIHRHTARLIIDLAGVTFCDCAGLSALLGAARRAALLDGELLLAAPNRQLRKILHITGLDTVHPPYRTVDATWRHISGAAEPI